MKKNTIKNISIILSCLSLTLSLQILGTEPDADLLTIEHLEELLTCAVCKEIAIDPRLTLNNYLFCHDCINQCNGVCPLTRQKLNNMLFYVKTLDMMSVAIRKNKNPDAKFLAIKHRHVLEKKTPKQLDTFNQTVSYASCHSCCFCVGIYIGFCMLPFWVFSTTGIMVYYGYLNVTLHL